MRKLKVLGSVLLCTLTLQWAAAQKKSPVDEHGQLSISGHDVLDKNGAKFQLRGMSLFWSQWPEGSKFYSSGVVKWIKDDWCSNIIRAAMAVDNGGYASNESEKNKIFTVVDAAIDNGIYVIIDFHVHDALAYKSQAIKFFDEVSKKYKGKPNVLYEIWNEPILQTWSTLKPYHVDIINTIRKNDPDNIIICGTRTYSQRVDEAALDPITTGKNIAYTFHFYSNTQKLNDYNSDGKLTYRATIQQAYNKGYCVFVTEYGTCDADGNGQINTTEMNLWWSFLDLFNISYVNWAIGNKGETSAALNGGASGSGGWSSNDLTTSGKMVRDKLKARCIAVGLDDNTVNEANAMQCYPNPFSKEFNIRLNGPFEYAVFDMTGNALEKGVANGSVELGGSLPTGLYVVKITDAQGSKFVKMTKN